MFSAGNHRRPTKNLCHSEGRNGGAVAANEAGNRQRNWVRRHPWATGLLGLVFVFFALSTIFADDRTASERAGLAVGFVILYSPLLAVTLLITWLIDRHRRRAVAVSPPPSPATGIPDASVGTASSSEAPSPSADFAADEEAVPPPSEPAAAEPFRPISRDDLLAMPPPEFEELCARALLELGYDRIRETGETAEHGTDLTATDAQGRSVVVRCVRNAAGLGVSSTVVQRFIGTIAAEPAVDRGVIVTTTEFTRSAIDLAAQHDVVIIDGDDLIKIVNLIGRN
jgi:hypothetical protein